MQIPTSAGMLANSVLPVTPTQGALSSQVGETAGSTSFAPVEAVTNTNQTRPTPDQRAQPASAPENSGQADISPEGTSGRGASKSGAVDSGNEDDNSTSIQAKPNEASDRTDRESSSQARNQAQQKKQDLELIRTLSRRDAEVHAHENAHSAIGGRYAGSATYTYQRGPDGVNYAVGGEVPIDVGVIPGDPKATLEKMLLVQRAALAPAEPSSQDRKVAALAAQQASQARAEIVIESRKSSSSVKPEVVKPEKSESNEATENSASAKEKDDKSDAKSDAFQAANDRIAKINEILVAISQNDTQRASGQLLDAVV